MNGLDRYQSVHLLKECQFETSRSSGKGGQHVNKTESRVTIVFNLENSYVLNEDQKNKIRQKISSKIQSGVIRVSVEDFRSQHRNKEIAKERFLQLIDSALHVAKPRRPTKISKAQKEKRLQSKKKKSDKKALRKKIRKDDI